jgi:hypothetical protein
VEEGAYFLHIRRLLKFGTIASNIRIYFSEDYFADTPAALTDAMLFLGLDPLRYNWLTPGSPLKSSPANSAPSETLSHNMLDPAVERQFRDLIAPYNAALSKLLQTKLGWKE